MFKLLMIVAGLLLAGGCGSPAPPQPLFDVRESVVDFGGFGPFRVGMTLIEVRKVSAGMLEESAVGFGCVSFIDTDTTANRADALQLLVTPEDGGRLVGIRAPIVARTANGIGIGSTHTEIGNAYAGFPVSDTESEAGPVVLVQKPGTEDYLGFAFKGDSIASTLIGTHDFAAGYELCRGSDNSEPPPPNTIRFDGIGALDLDLTAGDLAARGYANKGNLYEGTEADCVRYWKDGEGISFSVEQPSGRVLAIKISADDPTLRTEIGGLREGSTLADLRSAYADYNIEEYLEYDFGQGTNGVVVTGPGGAIAFGLADVPQAEYASGRATITYLSGVGLPGHAPTLNETGC